ncbi:RIP metalloprotease [Patescibacteria group bacterium]
MLLTIVAFVVVLGLLIFVHELGHFIAAKKAGCRVDEFGFGFPPKIFGIKRGETEYTINWLPIGGFVRIFGEDGSGEKDKKSFASKKAWVRTLILAAGISMNILLAAFLFSIGYGIGFPQAIPSDGIEGATITEEKVQVSYVEPDTPAAIAELETLDEIYSFNGVRIQKSEDLTNAVKDSLGEEVEVVIKRGGEEMNVTITPREEYPEDQGPIGIELVETGIVAYPWYRAVWEGIRTAFTTLLMIVVSLYYLIRDAIATGEFQEGAIRGPVGIAVLTGQFAKQGIAYLLWFAGFLSVNLALINALPFPALDGGRLLFIGIEKLRGGKKVKQSTENIIHLIGFGLLILMVVVITFRDVIHFQDGFINLWNRFLDIFR